MAKIYGTLVGALLVANPMTPPNAALAGGGSRQLRLDTAELNAAAVGDTISLGKYRWETTISPDSKVYYDALGAGVTVSVGDITTPNALSVATSAAAAGSKSLISSIDIANYGLPLWKLLGYVDLPTAKLVDALGAELLLTVAAATGTATGTVTWDIKGTEK